MASNSSKRWKFWKKQPDKSKKEAPLNNHESLLERVDEQKKIIIALKDECRRLEVTRRELDSYKNKCHNMEAKMSLQVKKLESDRLRLQESLRKTEVENKMLILALEKIKKNDNNNNINKNNNNNHSNNNSNNNNINRSIKNNDFNGSFNVMNNFNNNMNTEHSNNNSSYKEETRIINKNSDSNNNGNNDKNNNSDNNNNFSNKSNNRNNKKHDTQSMTKNNTKTDNTTNSNNTHNTTQANKQEDKDTKSTELNDNNKYEVYIAQIEELRNTVTRLEKENVFLHSLFQECLNGNARGLQRCMFASSPPPVYNHEYHQTSHLHKNNNKSNNHENNNNDHNNNINNNATLFNDKNQAIVVNGYEHNCHSSCGSSGSDSLSGLDNDGDKMNSNKDFENNPSDKHNEKPNEKGFNNREESINATTQEVTNDKDSKTSRDSRRRSSLSLNDFLDGEVLSETEKLLNIDQDDVCEPTDPFNDVTSGFYSFESDPKLHSVNHSFSSKSTFLVSAGSLKAGSSGEEERTLKRNKKDESFSGNCSNEVNHNGLEENKCSNSFLIDDKNDEKDYDGNETFNWEESSLSSVECSSLFVESCSERDDERKDSGSYDGVYDDDSVDDVFDDVMTAGNEIASRNNEVSALDGNTFNKNEKIDGVSNMKNNEFPSKTINQIDENNMDNGCENFLKNKKTRLNSKHSAESSEEDNIFMESLEDYFKKYRCIDDTFLLNKKRNSTKRNSLDDSTINNFSPCIYVPKRSFDETTLRIDLKAFCSKMLGNDMDRMRKMINLVKTNQGHAVLSDNVNSVVISKDKVSALKKYFEEKNSFDINKIKNKKKETKEMNNKSKKNLSCDSVKKEDGSDKANKPFKAPSIVKKTSDNFKPVQNKASDDVTIYKREENKTEGQTRAYLKSKTISPKSCHAPKLSSNVSNVSNSPKISVVSKSSEVSPKPQSVTQKSNINQKYLKNSVKNNDISCKASNINQSKKDKKVSQQTKKPLVSTPKQKRSSLSKQVKTTNTTNPPLVKLSLQNNVNKIFTKSPLPPRKLTKTTQPLHNITKANSSATKQSKDVKNSPLLKVTSRDFRASSVPSPLMPIKRNKPPSFRIAVAKTTSLKSFALQPSELKDMKSCRRKSPIRENIVANNTSKVDAFTASSSILHDIEKYKLHQMKSKNDFYSMLKENSNPFEDSFSKVSDFNRCNPNDKVSNKSSSSSMSYWDSDSKSEQASPKTFKMDNKFSNYRIASHKKNRNEANCISNISPSFVPSSQTNSKLCKPTNKKTQENSSNVNKNKIKTNDIKSKNDSSIETFNKYFNNMRSGLVDKPPNSINQKKPGNYTVSPKALKTTNNKTTGSNALKKNGAVTCGCRIKMSKEPPRVPRQKVSSVKTNGSVMNKSTSSSIRNSSSSLSSEPVSHMSLQNSYLLNDSFERTTDDMGKRADVCVGGPLMTQCSESAIMMRLKQCDAYDRNSFHDYKQDAQKPLQHETFDNSNHISKHNPQVYKQNQPKNQLADIKEKSNKTEKQKLPIFSSVGWMRKKPKTTSQTPNKSFQKPFFNLTKLQQPLNQPTLQTSNISSKSYPINTRSSLASYSTSPYSRLPLSVFKTKLKEVNT